MRKKPINNTYDQLAKLPLPHEAVITRDLYVGLIVPPSPFVVPCGWEWVHTAPFEGPSVIAALIKGLGFRFRLLDQRDDFVPESLSSKLTQFDVIGVAAYEDNFPYIKQVIELAKRENPDAPVILGGPLVTSAPGLVMENTLADYAVLGEGELTTIELMELLSGSQISQPVEAIKGLAWKKPGGEVIINEPRQQMENLEAVPLQDFSIWERFKNKQIPEIYLSTSRGCPHNCTFCYRAIPRLRLKSPERVRKEIEYLKSYHFQHAWINDLCFVLDKERTHQILDKAFNAHRFSWNCFDRVTGVDLDVLRHMKERGCDIILYGFEAISQDILDYYKKGITKDNMINAITITREAGIKVGGLFIIGSPGETKESLQRIIEFCNDFKEITRVKYLSAIPGTQLYRQAVKNGTIKNQLEHLYFLAREQSVEEDIDKKGFLLLCTKISKEDLRYTYHTINSCIEKRPYEYWQDQNTFLKQGKKFQRRPVTT
jgi:radical SAM superfamily enzyme YgiQ (UPF0313 family)